MEAQKPQEQRFQEYFAALKQLPEHMQTFGSLKRGEIEMVTDQAVMGRIEDAARAENVTKGRNPDNANIGIVYDDNMMWGLNDPQYVPGKDGKVVERGWVRFVWKNGVIGKSVIVVPYTDDGRVVMVPAFRHLAGRWDLELPGGGSMTAKTHQECVKFELLEEAGYTAGEITPLEPEEDGKPSALFCVDPSLNVTPIRAYAVKVVKKVEAEPELGEIFGKAMLFSLAQLKEVFRRGYVEHPTLKGVKCFPQSGRNGYGLLAAIFKGLIK